MSDAAVATIVGGLVTMLGMVIGFLKLWVDIRYGNKKAEDAAVKAGEAATKAGEVEDKLDANTAITSRIEAQTNGPLSEKFANLENRISAKFGQVDEHAARIGALELKVEAIKVSLDGLNKNLDSTRHEFRGHFQTIVNSLQLLAIKPPVAAPAGPSGE